MRNRRHARLWRGVKAELEESERQARQQATDKGVPHSASIALPVDLFAALGVEAHRAPTLAGSLGGGVDESWKCNAQPQWQRWQRGPPIGKKGADGWPARAGCATTVIWRIRLASESHAARAAPWEGQQQLSSSRATRRRAKARSSGAV